MFCLFFLIFFVLVVGCGCFVGGFGCVVGLCGCWVWGFISSVAGLLDFFVVFGFLDWGF